MDRYKIQAQKELLKNPDKIPWEGWRRMGESGPGEMEWKGRRFHINSCSLILNSHFEISPYHMVYYFKSGHWLGIVFTDDQKFYKVHSINLN